MSFLMLALVELLVDTMKVSIKLLTWFLLVSINFALDISSTSKIVPDDLDN